MKIKALGILVVFAVGCAQNTETPIDQLGTQSVVTPSTTNQDQATLAPQVYTWVLNAPARRELPSPVTDKAGNAVMLPLLDSLKTTDGEADDDLSKTNAGYSMAGINIKVTIGNTAPTVTGTATASGSGTQNPNATQTISPVQEVKPEASVAIPVGVALPGGIASPSAASSSRGNADLSNANTNDAKAMLLKAIPPSLLKDPQFVAVLNQFLAFLSPQPATSQPAAVSGGGP